VSETHAPIIPAWQILLGLAAAAEDPRRFGTLLVLVGSFVMDGRPPDPAAFQAWAETLAAEHPDGYVLSTAVSDRPEVPAFGTPLTGRVLQ
jgi:hypothetical protein